MIKIDNPKTAEFLTKLAFNFVKKINPTIDDYEDHHHYIAWIFKFITISTNWDKEAGYTVRISTQPDIFHAFYYPAGEYGYLTIG